MRTVAVVGGTGFLGRHVVAALREAGWEVRALSRRGGCDARRIEPETLRGCDAVVNLAGIKREEGEQTFQAVHVDLVERLVAAMKAAGLRRLVHVSVVVARAAPELPYHDSKWRGEEVVRGSGLEWTILRPAVIYGAGDDLLSHLSKMIHAAPVFPVVNDGRAPMMPVRATDVAVGVVGALGNPGSAGRTYDLVGPDRLPLREVVKRVAAALGRPVRILPTPVALMKIPVALMERFMKQPLSTRAQLAMLVEGLAGDPDPARADLGVEPAPFTPERLRPILEESGLMPRREVPAAPAIGLVGLAALLTAFAFLGPLRPWTGMTVAMAPLLAAALAFRAVRKRLRPTLARIGLGLAAAAALYGITRLGLAVLGAGWTTHAREFPGWMAGYPTAFLAATLVLIVAAEELFWRGVVSRLAVERLGRIPGVLAAAAVYAAVHALTLNPLLVVAALACGLFWGALAEAGDDLTAPVVCHLAWDVTILFLLPVTTG